MPKKLWDISDEAHASPTELGEHFMEKAFQAMFRVPRPMLSQWKSFLIGALGSAMPQHSPDDFGRVYGIYDLFRAGASPTPRSSSDL